MTYPKPATLPLARACCYSIAFHLAIFTALGNDFQKLASPQTAPSFSVSFKKAISEKISDTSLRSPLLLSYNESTKTTEFHSDDRIHTAKSPSAVNIGEPIPEFLASSTSSPYPLDELIFDFPLETLASAEAGWVKVRFFVSSDGRATQIFSIEAFPDERYVESAISGIARSRFAPAVKNGEKISAWVEMVIHFDFVAEQAKKNQNPSEINPSEF